MEDLLQPLRQPESQRAQISCADGESALFARTQNVIVLTSSLWVHLHPLLRPCQLLLQVIHQLLGMSHDMSSGVQFISCTLPMMGPPTESCRRCSMIGAATHGMAYLRASPSPGALTLRQSERNTAVGQLLF